MTTPAPVPTGLATPALLGVGLLARVTFIRLGSPGKASRRQRSSRFVRPFVARDVRALILRWVSLVFTGVLNAAVGGAALFLGHAAFVVWPQVPPPFRRGHQGVFAFVRHESHYYDEHGCVSNVRSLRERGESIY